MLKPFYPKTILPEGTGSLVRIRMGFQNRAKRWPSAWQLVLQFGADDPDEMVIEIRNVSASGFGFASPVVPPIGTPVQFHVVGARVTGFIVRHTSNGGAVAFSQLLTRPQLENLRQVRRLKGTPVPQKKVTQSDDALRRAISDIL